MEVARRIKRRLLAATKPGDVVVVFRSLDHVASRLRAVFTEFGIPFSLGAAERLIQSPLVRTLISVLRLAAEDWPFRRIVAVVTNNMFTALDADARAAANWLVRDLQIASGHRTLIDRVEALAKEPAELAAHSDHQRRRIAAARLSLGVFQSLSAALDELPRQGTIRQWCEALLRLPGGWGSKHLHRISRVPRPMIRGKLEDRMRRLLARPITAPALTGARAAWQALVSHLTTLARLDARLGESPRQLPLAQLLRTLLDVANHEPLAGPADETGRVRILPATAARTVTARHLYLAGLTEQAFPLAERTGRLYGDDDFSEIQQAAWTYAPSGADSGRPPLPTRARRNAAVL